ncbi:hypothetical protein HMN09_00980400 [Mycena chlorophos]|uniref:F-box domain-containing protein n=1 Tax=Mycena chlorophos TaxID=658473 RepID=A0A8H6SJ54_MYCCL|nr:hypothetical protein HMN09_00980400 [Mycena chlorophos]
MSVSPFAAKLGSNYVPCDEELEQLRAYIREPLCRLAALEDRMAALRAQLDLLTSQRDALKATIDEHKALLSPMRRVPEDILREVFEYCLAAEPVVLIDARRAPMLLTHVCAHWRHLAHAMPSLWGAVHIPGSTFSQPGGIGGMLKFNSAIVGGWLARTKDTTQPMSLSMSFRSLNQTLGIVLQDTFPRLRRLELTLESGDNLYMQPFLRQKPKDLPRLEVLKIDSKEDSGPHFWPGVELLSLPTLRSVSLRIRVDPMRLPLPWNDLLELNLRCFFSATTMPAVFVGGLSVADSLDVVRRCPRLRKCSFQITRGGQFQQRPAVHTTELRDLALSDAIFLPQFLERLDAPSLERLELAPKAGRENDDRIAFLRALQPHTAHLTAVDFVVTLFNTQTLTALLSMVPLLRCLTLRAGQANPDGVISREEILDNSVLGSLTPMAFSDASVYCPFLTHVEFFSCAMFSDWKLLEFIRARMTSQAATLPMLCSVVVCFERPRYKDILPAVADHMKAGLKLRLEYTQAVVWRYDPRAGLCEL